MREDNKFCEGSEEAVSSRDLYHLWLLPLLLEQPPIKFYPAPLVDFAERILERPDPPDWLRNRISDEVESLLGFSFDLTTDVADVREFSARAMRFAGSWYELELLFNHQSLTADEICNELIQYLDLVPAYFEYVDTEHGFFLQGTEQFRRESGLNVWLPAVEI
jgi:hypothetical protein